MDVRILSATHKNLRKLVTGGHFRQDLYYRLNVIELPMPSLLERAEDIPLLAEQFCARLAGLGMSPPRPDRWGAGNAQALSFPATCANWKISSNGH